MKKLLLILLFIPSMARAEFWTGNDLLNRLNSTEYMERMQGLGYVMGVYDAYVHMFFCPGSETGITVGQISDMARQYLAINPNQRHRAAYILVRDSFKAAWPCANTNNNRRGA